MKIPRIEYVININFTKDFDRYMKLYQWLLEE